MNIGKYISREAVRNAIIRVEAWILTYLMRRLTVPGVTNRDTTIRHYRTINRSAIDALGGTAGHRKYLTECFEEALDKGEIK